MSTHTPGPWELDTNHGIAIYPCGARIRMPDTPTASNMARKMADARLIAAAPDLLAALVTIAKIASEGRESDIDIESIARRAIAKAEGTQS